MEEGREDGARERKNGTQDIQRQRRDVGRWAVENSSRGFSVTRGHQ